MTKIRILGTLEIQHNGGFCPTPPPKVRCVLALLLSRANLAVAAETLKNELWGEYPPTSSNTTLQTYVYQLRRMFDGAGIRVAGGNPVVTHPVGYLLRVPREWVDANAFAAEVSAAGTSLAAGDPAEAARRSRQALSLCRGTPLADVRRGQLLEAYAVHLDDLRLRATELRVEAELQLGHHRELIGELQSLVAEFPLNEWFHGRLMVALDQSGRRAEALYAYRRLREVLNAELGLVPSSEIENLHLRVLEGSAS